MNDNDAQKAISNLFGIIEGIIPYGKKLTNQEKFELIYTRQRILEEKIEKALKLVREKGSDPHNYSPSLLLGDIREILEE